MFIRECLGSRECAPVSLGPLGVVVFTPVRPGCRWVHLGCLGSRGYALWVVGVTRVVGVT